LVQRLEDEDGQVVARFTPTVLRQVTTEAAARQMVRALTKAVSNQGTGKRAQLDLYDVAGKTGTAQKIEQGVYSHTKHYASFIGFFPADDPQLCLSVILDEPREGTFGGETAAPTFQRIAQRAASYLGIPPKEPSTPGSPGEKRWTTGRPTSPTLTSARPAWD
jgi:cell division protein FtsI/penicillin-binding protein 2